MRPSSDPRRPLRSRFRPGLFFLSLCASSVLGGTGLASPQALGRTAGRDPEPLPRPEVPVGVNVAKLAFQGGGISSSSMPFSDLMKVAHGFDAVDQADSYPVGSSVVPYAQVFTDLDAQGYPNEVVPLNGFVYGTYIGRGLAGRYPGGSYLVSFDGTGTLAFSGDVTSVQPLGTNQLQLEVSPSNSGIVLRILSSAGGSERVHNLRVVPLGLADASGDPLQTFHPEFLDRLAALAPRSIRFHNWKRISSGTVTALALEPPVDFYTYDRTVPGGGVPWTVVTELCETVGAEPWVNIPYDADLQAYVRPLAELFGDWSLATGLRVHVEYGNEVWNPTFAQQFCWILDDQQGCVPCDPSDPPPVNGEVQTCIAEFNAETSLAIFDLFREEFGSRGVELNAVRVLAGWGANAFYSDLLLDQITEPDRIDVFAIQSYFGSAIVRQLGWIGTLSLSTEALIDVLFQSIEGDPAGDLVRFLTQSADRLQELNDALEPSDDIVLAAYEGGQSLTFDVCQCPNFCPSMTDPICPGQISQLSQTFNDLNRDPIMLALYRRMFEEWAEVSEGADGVSGLWMHFTLFDRYGVGGQGSWGLFEFFDDPLTSAWKFQALLDVQTGR